jgi:RNA polymerase sigma-70 factor (sigma-E family)
VISRRVYGKRDPGSTAGPIVALVLGDVLELARVTIEMGVEASRESIQPRLEDIEPRVHPALGYDAAESVPSTRPDTEIEIGRSERDERQLLEVPETPEVLLHLVGLGVADVRAPLTARPSVAPKLSLRPPPPGLPQNDALACQEDMGHDRTAMASAVDRETGLRSRLADAYVRSAPGGIRLAYLLTGDRAVAEDLVQEAFVRFVGRLRFLRDPDAFEPYLRRTIVNLSKNHFRRQAVERAFLEREGPRIEDVRTDPDVATYDTLRSALLRLPLRQRTALVLRYFEDLPDATIAELLGCRQATVRSLVARGLEVLRTTPEVIA